MARQSIGEQGEHYVIRHVPCPNCAKRLLSLPKNYPLYDLQCTGCSFRAQVKTVQSPPKDTILGAGWEILNKVLKSGFLVPPLFVYFKSVRAAGCNHEVRFYPFVPKTNIRPYTLSAKARRANYRMFLYTGLNALPYFISHSSSDAAA